MQPRFLFLVMLVILGGFGHSWVIPVNYEQDDGQNNQVLNAYLIK